MLTINTELRLHIFAYVLHADHCYMQFPISDDDENLSQETLPRSLCCSNEAPLGKGVGPPILLVNRQISSEASLVLYGYATVVTPKLGHWRYKALQPGSVFEIPNGDAFNAQFESFYYPFIRDKVDLGLTHGPAPSRVLVTDLATEAYFNRTLALSNKLDRLFVLMQFHFWSYPRARHWTYQSSTSTLHPDLEQSVKILLKQAMIVKDVVKRVKRVSWIEHLDLDIYCVAFPPHHMNSISTCVKTCREIWRKGDWNVANLFLEIGILDPLQEVQNVGSWCIHFTVVDIYTAPVIAHERMELDLTGAVERKRYVHEKRHDLCFSDKMPTGQEAR